MRTFLAVLIVAAAGTSYAQDIPSTFDQLRVLVKPGDRVTVTGADSQPHEGRILDISPATLAVQVDGQRREFSTDEVQKITQVRHADLGQGAGWGAGAGAAFGLLTGLAAAGQCRSCGGWVLMSGLLWSGIGSGIGVGIAASMPIDHVVFARSRNEARRISFAPIVDPSQQGAMISVRW